MAWDAKVKQDAYGRNYDAETGEYYPDGSVLALLPKRQGLPYPRSLVMNQDMLLQALAKSDLGSEAFRVFFAVCAKLDFENLIAINQAELSRTIEMQPSHFSRGLKRLVQEGVIEPGPTVSGRRTFRLNDQFGWKGQTRKYREAAKRRAETERRASAAGLSIVGNAGQR